MKETQLWPAYLFFGGIVIALLYIVWSLVSEIEWNRKTIIGLFQTLAWFVGYLVLSLVVGRIVFDWFTKL